VVRGLTCSFYFANSLLILFSFGTVKSEAYARCSTALDDMHIIPGAKAAHLVCTESAGIVMCNATCLSQRFSLDGIFHCNSPGGYTTSKEIGCTATPLAASTESSSGLSTQLAVIIASALAVVIIMLAILLLVFLKRWSARHNTETGTLGHVSKSAQIQHLLALKMETIFSLSFSTYFLPAELAAACIAFEKLEVARKNVKLERIIGQGQSGVVFYGTVKEFNGISSNVAVKMFKEVKNFNLQADTAGEEALQLEARLLHQLRHPHIVQVQAVITKSLPTMVCLEFMQNGDLKTYLRCVSLVLLLMLLLKLLFCSF
jgi:hypothetical protein